MEPALSWVVLLWVGLAMVVIGWTDLVLLWYPLRFGSPEWEFATISAHLNGMPLGTIGLALLVAGSLNHGWRRTTRVLAVFCMLVTVLLLGISLLFLLDVPLALHGTPPAAKPVIEKGILKAGVFAVIYSVLYAWLGWFLRRRTRVAKT